MSDMPAPDVPSPAKSFGGASLTEGPVRGHLTKLAGFMAFGITASLISTLADAYFIAKLGTHELAALTFSFPVVMLIISLSIGFGTGVVSVISRNVGLGDQASVRALGTDSIVLATIITAMTLCSGCWAQKRRCYHSSTTTCRCGIWARFSKLFRKSAPA